MTPRKDTLKVGIVGTGSFARSFIPLYQAHPSVRAIALCDIRAERLAKEASEFGISETYPSFEAVLDSDCDALAIFTPRQTHAPFSIAALEAGKHVYSAVPVATSVEEIRAIESAVRRTGLTYMLGETSYYYPTAVLCRELWRQGKFGRFVYGEGEYMHDMEHGFYEPFQHSGGPQWKRVAGIPPMFYPTHSASMILCVTGAHFTQVSCLGQRDEHEDAIFRKGANHWDNEFSNQTALLRTSDGGTARLNEFRRIGFSAGRSVRVKIFGTRGCFEEHPEGDVFYTHDYQYYQLKELLNCSSSSHQHDETSPQGTQEDFFSGLAPVHPQWRLPQEFQGLPNGHYGSHQFLVDDFVRACRTGALAPNHIWAAARYNIPGLIAHESSLRGGELLDIPDLGAPPTDSTFLEDELNATAPTWALPQPSRRSSG